MKRGKLAVCVLTILLMIGAAVVGKYDMRNYHFPFTVCITADGQTQEISCHQKWGEYYVFLPAYAQQVCRTAQGQTVGFLLPQPCGIASSPDGLQIPCVP